MADDTPKRISAAEAQAKAAECRALAKWAAKPEHKVMLEHIAQTWERIMHDVFDSQAAS